MKPEKLKSGSWRCKVFLGKDSSGKQIFKSVTAPTKKEALAKAAELAADNNRAKQSRLTVGYCIDQYIKDKESELSPHTVQGYRAMARIRYDSIRDIPLSDITTRDVQRLMAELSDLSTKTKKNVLGLLTAALRYFEKPLDTSNVKIGRQKKEKFSAPPHDSILKLIEGAEGELKLAIMLGALCGLRRGEVFGMRCENVDLKKKQIYIDSALVEANGIRKIGLTKNDSSVRCVDLPDIVSEELKKHISKDKVYIFTTPMSTTLKRFFRLRSSIPECNSIRFHDLRHYYASALIIAGVPDTYAMKMGGWKTPTTLRKVYQSIFEDQFELEKNKVNQVFNSRFK